MVDVILMLTARMQPEVTCAFVNADRDSQILRHLDLSSAKVIVFSGIYRREVEDSHSFIRVQVKMRLSGLWTALV